MSYEILITADGLSILHITTVNYDSLKGWRVEFHDGKEAMLYKENEEWVQYNEPWLDKPTLIAIGHCIDDSMMKKSKAIKDSYFYNILVN